MSDKTNESYGLSQKDFFTFIVLNSLEHKELHGADLYRLVLEYVPNKQPSRSNFYNTLKKLEREGLLSTRVDGKKIYYAITAKGKETKSNFYEEHYSKFKAIKRVLDIFYADVKGEKKGPIEPLKDEYRVFFSKLVSVRDLIKYAILKELLSGSYGTKKPRFYVKDMRDTIKQKYGWDSSVSYIYDIAHLIEEEDGYLVGKWVDKDGFESSRRFKRIYQLTDEGAKEAVFRRISSDVASRIEEVRKVITSILEVFDSLEKASANKEKFQ
jgi:DNA-binding PadR family transcriptional regulator